MAIDMNLSILSLDKGQDFGLFGKAINSKGEEFDWMIGCDGHGGDAVINLLRSLNWNTVMSQDDSLEEILRIIARCGRQYQSTGSTYMEAKIFKDRIETCSVGDSKIMVFMDEELIYESTEHNLFNPSEKERLQPSIDEGTLTVADVTTIPYILSPTKITNQTKHYYTFSKAYTIAMTQSLGHNNITGIQPERKVIPYTPENKVRVILMSDGVQDIICSEPEYYPQDIHTLCHYSSSEIASMSETRWKQQWQFHINRDNETFMLYSFATPHSSRSGFDDVLVVTCDILPIQQEEEVPTQKDIEVDFDDGDEQECDI
jgi:serine/threonine protein phosphatase PrpC